MVAGVFAKEGGTVTATKCSFDACLLRIGDGSSMVGSKLRFRPGSMAGLAAVAETGNGLPGSFLKSPIELHLRSTTKLSQCRLEGFLHGVAVSGLGCSG